MTTKQIPVEKRETNNLKSREVLLGSNNAPHRSFYKAMGLGDADLEKPLIGVANTWNEATPCNVHLNLLANKASEGSLSAVGLLGNLSQLR